MKFLYIIACSLLLVAITSDLIAKQYFTASLKLRVNSAKIGLSEQMQAKEKTKLAVHRPEIGSVWQV